VSALVGFLVGSGLYGTAWDLNSPTVRKFGWGYLTFGHGPSAIIVVAPTKKHWRAGRTDSGTTSLAMADANAFLLGPRTCQSKGFT